MTARTEDNVLLVAQVRPKRHGWALVGALIGNTAGYFLAAWIIMLLLPFAFGEDFAWGYWRVLAAYYIVKTLVHTGRLLPTREEVK